jgi:hypothetical protein
MTAENYYSLTLEERGSILWDVGVFLDSIDYYNQRVCIYCLFNFFVEVYYSLEDNKIESLQVVGPDELKKFLGQIKISID